MSRAPRPPVEWIPFVVMVVVLGASVLMYLMLVRRWTSRRQWVSLARWCRESGFRMRPAKREVLPAALQDLTVSDLQVRFHLCDEDHTLVQFQTDPPAPGAPPPRWNVLIRNRAAPGPVAALKPAAQRLHLIDLLPLSKYESMTLPDRFIVHAMEAHAARALAESSLPSLLPPDLGLILLEQHLVLDFSARPFDPLEFGRIIALAEQLARVV